jgi:xanthine dehydrogenase YagS FAD-binding subunit
MNAFEYASPSTKEQAIQLLGAQWGETEVLAGGTDLLSLMKTFGTAPKRVVDIQAIQEFQGIDYIASSGLRLGALATLAELIDRPAVQKVYPSLAQAASGVRSQQIQSFGTIGGDLCQRPRCWYFRNGFGYFPKDSSGQDLVRQGENQYHAILGNSGQAAFVSASSLGPPLIALDATFRIFGSGGSREVAAAEFFKVPQHETDRETVLKPNEILGEILVPPADDVLNATYEVREKEALDWPLVTASVALKLSAGKVKHARVVLGHVAPTPWSADQAGKGLMGMAIDEKSAVEAGNAAVAGATPLSKNGYKVRLVRVAVKRAILNAVLGGA